MIKNGVFFPQYSKLILLTTLDILMIEKPTYKELERKINQLEREILEYVRKEKEFTKEQKLVEYGHVKRTMSLMKINEELNKEIKGLKHADKKELGYVSDKLEERIKEIKCLYDISSLRDGTNFSMDDILQGIVDFIPSAIQYPEIACARILFNHYDFITKNFKGTKWKLSQEIKVNNKRIGALEVYYLEEKQDLEEEPFSEETKNLIASIAESIAQIVERDWAEIEIRKCRQKIEETLKQN
ncbi:MAG: hypothetical protein OET21_09240 [Desulfobacterales bacterium]|jgi:hypothetical protein|nr:hypothetical protein [Desulfobacterales bacterium]